jgi:hypothetical protein
MDGNSSALERATQLAYGLSKTLVPAVDPATVSTIAKIPFKVLLLRELFAYRLAELSISACDLFRDSRNIAATTLTRGALEAVAGLFFLDRRTRKCLDQKTLGNFSEFVNRLLLGSRHPKAKYEAYNVLNAIDELAKVIPGFRRAYDMCSEFAHPNADGLINSYGRMDHETLLFNLDPRKYQAPLEGIVSTLAAGLEFFIHVYDEMPLYLPEFAKLCEAKLALGEV